MADKTELIKDYVQAALGAPALPAELEVSSMDLDLAMINYYKYVPIKVPKVYSFIQSRETTQTYANIISDYLMDKTLPTGVEADKFFYVGLLQFGTLQSLGQARFDEYLLGQWLQRPAYDPLKHALYNTQLDINVGDPYYIEDEVGERIQFIVGGIR
jgi:hypothetical protein